MCIDKGLKSEIISNEHESISNEREIIAKLEHISETLDAILTELKEAEFKEVRKDQKKGLRR